jgi:hypothetical protein
MGNDGKKGEENSYGGGVVV